MPAVPTVVPVELLSDCVGTAISWPLAMSAFLLFWVKIIGRLMVLKRLVLSRALRMTSKLLPMEMMPPHAAETAGDPGGQRGEGVERGGGRIGGGGGAGRGGTARGRVGGSGGGGAARELAAVELAEHAAPVGAQEVVEAELVVVGQGEFADDRADDDLRGALVELVEHGEDLVAGVFPADDDDRVVALVGDELGVADSLLGGGGVDGLGVEGGLARRWSCRCRCRCRWS